MGVGKTSCDVSIAMFSLENEKIGTKPRVFPAVVTGRLDLQRIRHDPLQGVASSVE